MHKHHARQPINILRVAKYSLTISFRKGNRQGHHALSQNARLHLPLFIVASRHEPDDAHMPGEECLDEKHKENSKDF
jgi:hypothetical protein